MMICVECNMEVVREEDYVGTKYKYLVLCKRCFNAR